jgi:hypothetical protein
MSFSASAASTAASNPSRVRGRSTANDILPLTPRSIVKDDFSACPSTPLATTTA